MKTENKDLLLKDLCTRLPYRVKGLHRGQVHELFTIDSRDVNNVCLQVDGYDAWFSIETFKPYLRSVSSMTEKEINKFILISDIVLWLGNKRSICILSLEQTDWLNKKMFDYRGLIRKGLAIKAPENMYR